MELQKWDQQPGESQKAYFAFTIYRDLLPSERSLPKAETIFRKLPPERAKKKPSGNFTKWSIDWSWAHRAYAYDHYLETDRRRRREESEREAHEAELKKSRQRQLQASEKLLAAANGLLGKTAKRLNEIDARHIPVKSIASFFRAAAALYEAGTNSEAQALALAEILMVLNAGDKDSS